MKPFYRPVSFCPLDKDDFSFILFQLPTNQHGDNNKNAVVSLGKVACGQKSSHNTRMSNCFLGFWRRNALQRRTGQSLRVLHARDHTYGEISCWGKGVQWDKSTHGAPKISPRGQNCVCLYFVFFFYLQRTKSPGSRETKKNTSLMRLNGNSSPKAAETVNAFATPLQGYFTNIRWWENPTVSSSGCSWVVPSRCPC